MIKNLVDTFTNWDINVATLTGSIDIIVIERKDGSLASTPFHTRFGKLKVLRTTKKQVMLIVNGVDTGLKMKLGKGGEAYFEYETDDVNAQDEFKSDEEEDNNNQDPNNVKLDEPKKEDKSKWFWNKFGKEEKEVDADPSKKGGFIRKLGDFFGKKNIPEVAPGEETVYRPLLQENIGGGGKIVTDYVQVPISAEQSTLDDARKEHERMLLADEVDLYNQDQVSLSLCRYEISEESSDLEVVRIFMKHKIPYEVFTNNFDEILKHPNLIIKIHDGLYNPDIGIPQIISLLAFGKTINIRMSKGPQQIQKEDEEVLAAVMPGQLPQDAEMKSYFATNIKKKR